MRPRRPRFRAVRPTLVAGLALLSAACNDTLGLPAPAFANVVDTVSLFALSGTPLKEPSAFRLDGTAKRVRTDQSGTFDFAFDVDTLGRAVLLPTGAVGLGQASGLQATTLAFAAITLAPTGGYVLDRSLVVTAGTVALVRSRPAPCALFGGAVTLYAKLQVLAVDLDARRLDFQVLVDENCGYRGLEPGLPKR